MFNLNLTKEKTMNRKVITPNSDQILFIPRDKFSISDINIGGVRGKLIVSKFVPDAPNDLDCEQNDGDWEYEDETEHPTE